MPNLRDIKRKIEAVKKIGQITRAMNMVAAAKLRGAQERVEQFRPYASKFKSVISELVSSKAVDPSQFALMQAREVKKVEIVLITADRGLCGAFNANLINRAEKLIKAQRAQGREVSMICVGKKGAQYFRKFGFVRQAYEDIMSRVEMFNARAVAREAMTQEPAWARTAVAWEATTQEPEWVPRAWEAAPAREQAMETAPGMASVIRDTPQVPTPVMDTETALEWVSATPDTDRVTGRMCPMDMSAKSPWVIPPQHGDRNFSSCPRFFYPTTRRISSAKSFFNVPFLNPTSTLSLARAL